MTYIDVATTIGLIFGSLCLVWAAISFYVTRNGTMKDYIFWLMSGVLVLFVLEIFTCGHYLSQFNQGKVLTMTKQQAGLLQIILAAIIGVVLGCITGSWITGVL